MLQFTLPARAHPLAVLCLGAHPDDIEIGCGGTLHQWLIDGVPIRLTWVVFSGDATRAMEARASASSFACAARECRVVVTDFRDGFFPFQGAEIKQRFEAWKQELSPDVIFTHSRDDRHQDHRLISDLTWQTFRDHLVLEYEIPKYDGDLGRPNCYVPISEAACHEKIQHLLTVFDSQKKKPWFTESVFRALMRLRGMECGAPSGYAEAFHANKVVLMPSSTV